MNRAEKPVFEVNALSISFNQYGRGLKRKEIQAIEGLSIELYKGKIHAVFGESGSGKSLLAHAILDILPQNACLQGNFYYDGNQISRGELKALRGKKIALVPQSVEHLNPVLKIGRQLALSGVDKDKVKRLLEKYELSEAILNLYPFQLSGGMSRKVLLMMAVSQGAEIIIADEPTPGLDASSIKVVLADFQKVAKQGCAVLFITHDISAAIEVADEITIFKNGKRIDHLLLDEGMVLEDHLERCHPFTKALYHAMPVRAFFGGS